jgi:hypothetical protein
MIHYELKARERIVSDSGILASERFIDDVGIESLKVGEVG